MANEFSSIKNHSELKFRIMQLESQRAEQELDLKKGIKELYHAMHPINLLKKMVSDFAGDKQVQFDATKIGLNFGSDFLIGKILGSNMSIPKYFGSLILQKASDYVLNNHPEKLAWGIEKVSNIFRSFSKKETPEPEMEAE